MDAIHDNSTDEISTSLIPCVSNSTGSGSSITVSVVLSLNPLDRDLREENSRSSCYGPATLSGELAGKVYLLVLWVSGLLPVVPVLKYLTVVSWSVTTREVHNKGDYYLIDVACLVCSLHFSKTS